MKKIMQGLRKENYNYKCAECGHDTKELHEIWPGTGRRQFCIDNYLQIPLCHNFGNCRKHWRWHNKMSRPEKIKYQSKWCRLLGIDFDIANLAINASPIEDKYFKDRRKECYDRLMGMRI